MACLYVAFSYVGCEISYPLKVRPILTDRQLLTYLLTYLQQHSVLSADACKTERKEIVLTYLLIY